MFKKDIDCVKRLYEQYEFKGPLLDAGGLSSPTIADYDVSINSAISISIVEEGVTVRYPNKNQSDRYVQIARPWSFIDPNYVILNPEYGDPVIEQLPIMYKGFLSVL